MYPGIADRMQKEITALAPSTMKIKIIAHQRGSTPSGLGDLSLLLCPPSNRCGSPSRNMMNPAHPLSTGSVSKRLDTALHPLQNILPLCDLRGHMTDYCGGSSHILAVFCLV